MNRREFIRGVAGAAAGFLRVAEGGPAVRFAPEAGTAYPPSEGRRKLIVVVFGGGTRYSESMGDPDHRHVPRLWHEMVPRGTLFGNVRVEGTIVHTNCTASILTGFREYDADHDWSRPVANPTLFEVVRKHRRAPDTAAWAFVYASILSNCGQSTARGFGMEYAANVIEPPTVPRLTAERMAERMQRAAATGSLDDELEAAAGCARMARVDGRIAREGLRSEPARRFLETQYEVWKSSPGTTSHDAFLADRAIACMNEFAPDVLAVAFGEIDCAHYGSWSRYVDAIRRTDQLTWRLWQAATALDAYRGRTLMLILPDHGRELERPDGMGFIHHSDFYSGQNVDEGCRRVWMLAIGPDIAAGRRIDEPVPALAAAATGLEFLGLAAPPGAAQSVLQAASG